MLRTENLSFFYKTRKGTIPVFQGLDLSFSQGLNVILGPNGAGKSTLLKAIFGLLNYQGLIRYGRENLRAMTTEKRSRLMSYLPQMDVSSSMLSVMEMVLLGRLPDLNWTVQNSDLERVFQTLETLNIAHLASRNFGELSGGQKRTVFIAQTLVRNPQIILLDEPLNSLDLQKQLELCHILRKLAKDTIIIVVLHDLNLAARFADWISVLDKKGRLYGSGKPGKIITQEMLIDVYGVLATVSCDEGGRPTVSPLKSVRKAGSPQG